MLRYGHVTTGEFLVARPDGSRVAVEIRATILEDGRVQVIARDISERKEIERAKDEFVSIVSHELRTPLTSIRGALGLLAAGRLDATPEKRQRMLQLAASNTDRLIRLINDILDSERLKAGGVMLDRVEGVRTVADRAGVHLRWHADDIEVWADADRMTQTLTNLIDNAIKFSSPGAVVDVKVTSDRGMASFAVRDSGRGIPADKLDAVFNRFQQVDASDAREKGGSGLGLAICKSIVEQHGGRIWVESTAGKGSVFRFTVPLAAEHKMSSGDPAAPRVLVCDDDGDLVEVLRATLMQRGFRVVGARRGKDAIAIVDADAVDVALVDIVLPDINGVRLVRHIHAASPSTSIVVYTATYLDGPERDFIRGIGATIVTKGRTSPDALADEVARIVAASNALRAG
jgi:CheY-like chemotaxis protein